MLRWLPALSVLIALLAPAAAPAQSSAPPREAPARQWWAGHVEMLGPIGPVRLPIMLTLAQDEAGAWHASLDIAPESNPGLLAAECTDVRVTPEALSLTLALSPPMSFHAERMPPGGDEARGEFHADGMPPLSATLRRVTQAEAAAIVPARPQTPRPPFPYPRTEVRVTNPTDGVSLAGTLTLPAAEGPHPAVLLVTGGGLQDRDHQVGFHRPFLVIADHLTRAGVATLRLDDRGMAPSGGSPLDATPDLLAGDIRAAVAMLRATDGIDPQRIGVLALGEGTLPAAMAAAEDETIAWLALIAPQGLPGGDVIVLREQRRMEAEGEDPAYIAAQTEATRRLMDLLAGRGNHEQVAAAIREAMLTGIHSLRGEGLRPEEWELEEAVSSQLHEYTSPSVRAWIAADPRTALAKVRVPVLLVAGELDRVMPVGDTFPAAEAALREAGAEVAAHRLPGLNYLLQPAVTGFNDEIATIRTTIDAAALELITQWIKARAPRER